MRADWWTVICLCAFLCGFVNCASVNSRSEVVKKDTFVITGNATTNGRKTELNIHVESKGQKPQGPPQPPAPLPPSAASTQIPPTPGQNNNPTGQVTGASGTPSATPTKNSPRPGQYNKPTGKGTSAAGTPGQNQVNGSTKGPTNQQPSKSLGPTPWPPSATPTKNPPKTGLNNKPTGNGTSAAGTPVQNQITGSTKGPTNQQPSKSLGSTPTSGTSTKNPLKPSPNNKPTGKGTSAAGTPGQNQINASTKGPKKQQPKKGPGPTPPNTTPTRNPTKPGQNTMPSGQVTSLVGTPGQNQVTALTKRPKNQQPNKGPGTTPPNATPTQNPSKPGQNTKPTGQVTSASGKPGQNQINALTEGPKSQQPSKGPGPTLPNTSSTQNPSKPGQNNKPTGQVTTAGGTPGQNQINASTKPPATKAPTSTQKPGQPSQPASQVTSAAPAANPSKGKGKAFQVIKPTSKNPKSQTPNSAQSGATSSPPSSKVPATVSPPPVVFSDEENMALIAHNSYREIHGSKPMELKEDLVDKARAMAKKLASSAKGDLIHEKSDVLDKMNQRESLAKVCSKEKITTLTAIEQIVDKWYGEVCLYNFENPDPAFNGTSHFTQLAWNNTNELGFGAVQKKVDGQYCLFAAARYRPQGNINDKQAFKRNIKKGKFDPFVNNCVVSSQADVAHM